MINVVEKFKTRKDGDWLDEHSIDVDGALNEFRKET